jgi:hypothetical protein
LSLFFPPTCDFSSVAAAALSFALVAIFISSQNEALQFIIATANNNTTLIPTFNLSRLHQNTITVSTMPALDPRIIQGLADASVILRRGILPTHEIIEAFLVSKFSSSYNPLIS